MSAAALAANAYTAAARKYGGEASGLAAPSGGGAKPEQSFGSLLAQAMDSVSETGKAADTAAVNSTAGRTDMIDVVTAVAESETAMQTLISVRDRVISAYEEIMRMAI